MKENSPVRDNILLAQAKLIDNEQLRAEKLTELHQEHQDTDGGIQALYELGLLKISLWRQQDESNPESKKKHLEEAKKALTDFISLYPDSFYVEQIQKNLDSLPSN